MKSEWFEKSSKDADPEVSEGNLSQRQSIMLEFARKMYDNPTFKLFMKGMTQCIIHAKLWESVLFDKYQNDQASYVRESTVFIDLLAKLQNSVVDSRAFLKSYREIEHFKDKLAKIREGNSIKELQLSQRINEVTSHNRVIETIVIDDDLGQVTRNNTTINLDKITKKIDFFPEGVPEMQDLNHLIGILANRINTSKQITDSQAVRPLGDRSTANLLNGHVSSQISAQPQITNILIPPIPSKNLNDPVKDVVQEEVNKLLQVRDRDTLTEIPNEEKLTKSTLTLQNLSVLLNSNLLQTAQPKEILKTKDMKTCMSGIEAELQFDWINEILTIEENLDLQQNTQITHPVAPLSPITNTLLHEDAMKPEVTIIHSRSSIENKTASSRRQITTIIKGKDILFRFAFRQSLTALFERNSGFKKVLTNVKQSKRQAAKVDSAIFEKTKGDHEAYKAESDKYLAFFTELLKFSRFSEVFAGRDHGFDKIEPYLTLVADDFKTLEEKLSRRRNTAKKNHSNLPDAPCKIYKIEESNNRDFDVEEISADSFMIQPFVESEMISGSCKISKEGQSITLSHSVSQGSFIDLTQKATKVKQNVRERSARKAPVIKALVPIQIPANDDILRVFYGKIRFRSLNDVFTVGLYTCDDIIKINALPDIRKQGTINGILEMHEIMELTMFQYHIDKFLNKGHTIISGWIMCNNKADKQKLLDYSNKLLEHQMIECVEYTISTCIYITHKSVISSSLLEKLKFKSKGVSTSCYDTNLVFIIKMEQREADREIANMELEIMDEDTITKGVHNPQQLSQHFPGLPMNLELPAPQMIYNSIKQYRQRHRHQQGSSYHVSGHYNKH